MSTAEQKIAEATIISRTVTTAATRGYGAILAGDECTNASTNGKVVGVFLKTVAAGSLADIATSGVVPVKVGTGGATQGEFAIHTTDGWTDQTLGGGSTVKYIGGRFTQTGIAGDVVGMLVGPFAGGA